MTTPEEALETLDKAAHYLRLLMLGKVNTHPAIDIARRIEHMRDELFAAMIEDSLKLGADLWAWLKEPT